MLSKPKPFGKPLMAVNVKLGRELGTLVLTENYFVVFAPRVSKKRLLPVAGEVFEALDWKAAAELTKLEGEELARALEERGFNKVLGWIAYDKDRMVEVKKGIFGTVKLKIVHIKGSEEFRLESFPGGLSVGEQKSKSVSKLKELGLIVIEERRGRTQALKGTKKRIAVTTACISPAS